MKVLFFTNIVSPYRNEFYNQLGKHCDLTVVYQAEYYSGVPTSWHGKAGTNYKAIFLNKGSINERRVNFCALKYLFGKWDAVFFTNYGYLGELFLIVSAIFLRVKFGLVIDGMVRRKDNFFKRFIKKLIFSSAAVVCCPSKVSSAILLEYCSRINISKYNFSSLTLSDLTPPLPHVDKEIIKRKYNISGNLIVAAGQFIYRKGYDLLLEALSHTNSVDVAVIVGGEPTDEYLMLASNANCKVIFEGFLERSELFKLISAADIFIHPTREDVWGLAVNEALGLGVPVISTDQCNAALEMIQNGRNGYVVKSNDAFEISDAIEKCYFDSKTLKEMSHNAYVDSLDWNVEGMVQSHLELISQITNKS